MEEALQQGGPRRPVDPAETVRPRPAAKKDTKRWCLGREGREHKPEWKREGRHAINACAACGKRFEFRWGIGRRVAIIGSREYPDMERVRAYVATLPEGTVVLSGAAPGVDTVAAEAARARGLEVVEIPALWRLYGKGAGPIRNSEIVEQAEKVIAFWDWRSPGTWDAIRKAQRHPDRRSIEIAGPDDSAPRLHYFYDAEKDHLFVYERRWA